MRKLTIPKYRNIIIYFLNGLYSECLDLLLINIQKLAGWVKLKGAGGFSPKLQALLKTIIV